MADDNQVGVVGRGQAPAQTPQRGIPGVAQPPRPTPEETQRVIQDQQRRLAAEAQEAARRAAELAKTAQPGQPVHGMELPRQQRVPDNILEQMPPEMRSMTQPIYDRFPGEDRDSPHQGAQTGNQFERRAGPPPVKNKTEIPWWPIRSNGVSIELQNSILKCLPEKGMAGEGDAAAKVVLAILDEVLCLREALWNLESSEGFGGAQNQDLERRVYQLEAILLEQRKSMSARARSVREQVEMLQSQGLSSDEIVKALHDQSSQAEAMVQPGRQSGNQSQ